MAKYSRTILSEYGSKFGGFLIQVGKENFDLKYNEKKRDGSNPFMPLNAIPKYFVKRTEVTNIGLMPSPNGDGGQWIIFNNDSKLCVPCNTPMVHAEPIQLSDLLRKAKTPEDLERVFFDNEESVVDIVETFNKMTIQKIDQQMQELAATIEGLENINKISRATMEAAKIDD